MENKLRLAIAQTTSYASHYPNIELLDKIVKEAEQQNIHLLALPEAFGLLNRNNKVAQGQVVDSDNDPFLLACKKHAARSNLWIQAGSTPVRGKVGKFLNRSTLINNFGRLVAHYDKIHLFDIFLRNKPPTGESSRYEAGKRAVVVETDWGKMALTICYDLRFPKLYRDLAQRGALLAFIPSAFTVPTGQAHWEILLRARAIENGMWIVAAAQVGEHEDGRRTWGHSLVISPWGEVICDLGGHKTGLGFVEINMNEALSARAQIPAFESDRDYSIECIYPIEEGN